MILAIRKAVSKTFLFRRTFWRLIFYLPLGKSKLSSVKVKTLLLFAQIQPTWCQSSINENRFWSLPCDILCGWNFFIHTLSTGIGEPAWSAWLQQKCAVQILTLLDFYQIYQSNSVTRFNTENWLVLDPILVQLSETLQNYLFVRQKIKKESFGGTRNFTELVENSDFHCNSLIFK